MKRARIIYNPTSGREGIKEELIQIIQVYEKAGYETSIFATTPKHFSARDEANRAGLDGFDLIVAAGGDGTVNEVINGVSSLEKRPKIAVIPAGTTNDFARALNIPRNDLLDAAKTIELGETAKIDIGKVDNQNGDLEYFMNIAALGTLSEVTYSVPSTLKSLYGYLAYVTKGAELITRIKSTRVLIKHDQGEFNGEVSLILLALTNSVGGFEKIVPNARLDDGKFSLLIIKKTNLAQLLVLITKAIANGKHVNDPLVEYVKTSKVSIIPQDKNDEMKVNLDGEYGGDAPISFTNLKQHIEFVSPKTKILARFKKNLSVEEMIAEKAGKEIKKEIKNIENED
ncbi:MAG: diacylglycerol kinase family lipid kinase [Lactobacillaceae bacterium]|jgi:diacylglycerol kinase (ATP)|nr:diacylglycerol kinase family lipid kinase [Lactobacillaceae bacterium]